MLTENQKKILAALCNDPTKQDGEGSLSVGNIISGMKKHLTDDLFNKARANFQSPEGTPEKAVAIQKEIDDLTVLLHDICADETYKTIEKYRRAKRNGDDEVGELLAALVRGRR